VGGTGEKHQNYDVHRSVFAIYISVSNIGGSATSIENVEIGYHWPISFFLNPTLWFRKRMFRHWIKNQTVSLSDFYHQIDQDSYKGYPFLIQKSTLTGEKAATYLNVGQSTNGVVYFEQDDSFGACFPLARKGFAKIRICVVDTLGQKHSRVELLPRVSLDAARRYNPKFGMTLSGIRSQCGLIELRVDRHGNILPLQPETSPDNKAE
jgi:hypothetical protein